MDQIARFCRNPNRLGLVPIGLGRAAHEPARPPALYHRAEPSALASLLGEQKGFLSSLLPAGIGSLLGWTGYETARPRETTAYVAPKRETESWFVPLLVLSGIVLAALGGC